MRIPQLTFSKCTDTSIKLLLVRLSMTFTADGNGKDYLWIFFFSCKSVKVKWVRVSFHYFMYFLLRVKLLMRLSTTRTRMKIATRCQVVLKNRPQIPSKWPYRVRTGVYPWVQITVKTNPRARCGTARVVKAARRRVGWKFDGRWLNWRMMWVDTDWFGTTVNSRTETKWFYLAM